MKYKYCKQYRSFKILLSKSHSAYSASISSHRKCGIPFSRSETVVGICSDDSGVSRPQFRAGLTSTSIHSFSNCCRSPYGWNDSLSSIKYEKNC